MKIIICGAGKVGTSIARHLVDQGSDVTVIDSSYKLIDDLREKVDLKTVIGSASNPSVLKNAGAEDTDDHSCYSPRRNKYGCMSNGSYIF